MSDHRYRVWVEKHQVGWVYVSAPCQDKAQDRAWHVAVRGAWTPERSTVSTMLVELVREPAEKQS